MAATLLMPGCAVASARASAASPAAAEPARTTFERFIDLLYRRRQVRAAFESCVVASGFRDHGHGEAASRAVTMASLARTLGDHAELSVLHAVFDGDIGMVHLRTQEREGAAARPRVEIFRFESGRIVEHWSVA